MEARDTRNEDAISLVLPTFNRAGALRENLPNMLAMDDLLEVVVVNDGSSDDTLAVCEELAGPLLRVVSHDVNRGVATARNTGVDAARGTWIVFGEDDCRFPRDYAAVLRRTAHLHRADIVGAPLLHTAAPEHTLPAIAASSPRRQRPSMDDVDVFPFQAVETPFLPARALIRREIFDRLRYYEGFDVNGYREETDFFVQAARAGYRCMLTPDTYCYQQATWHGGQHHTSSLRYEAWVLRNNWRFLRRHGSWLADEGYISGPARSQAGFTLQRIRKVGSGVARARAASALAVLAGRRPPAEST